MPNATIHSTAPIPLAQRRGPITMGLLWITMVTFFPSLLIGFEWCKNGFTFSQVLWSLGISYLILLAYSLPATQLGAQTGLGYATLVRGVFGRFGSWLAIINLIVMFTVFYGLTALFEADSLNGLFHLNWSLPWFAAALAVIMSFNNFFGFRGIANFARYVAAPMLIIWVLYSFSKAVTTLPGAAATEAPHVPFGSALTTISSFIIGFTVWGNEKDYWRFSVPKPVYALIPLMVAMLFGLILFPLTGWMIAKTTGITNTAAATAYMSNYSFGGMAWLAALVLSASYFATNDSNLFAMIHGCESIKDWSHRTWVIILTIAGAILAYVLALSGTAKALETITSLGCVTLPTPTVIMLVEWFLLTKIFKVSSRSHIHDATLHRTSLIRWPAMIALLCGLSAGILSSGVIPVFESFHGGISCLQAWLSALIIYVPLRIVEHRRMVKEHKTILEKILAKRFAQASSRHPRHF